MLCKLTEQEFSYAPNAMEENICFLDIISQGVLFLCGSWVVDGAGGNEYVQTPTHDGLALLVTLSPSLGIFYFYRRILQVTVPAIPYPFVDFVSVTP